MLDKILDWISKHLYLTIAIVAIWRLLFLFSNELDLLGDESYYWDWSRQPDWCYYSKPPMVAWLIALTTAWLGDSTAIVRLPTVILGSVFLAYFHATTKLFYGARPAALALLLILVTPMNVLANFLMTIDPPLYCFWIMSLYYLSRALFFNDTNGWWLAGLASAAALLSKQVALALPLLLLVFLVLEPHYRRYLKREIGWYLLPIVLAALPLLLWNMNHDWVMWGHSKGHFAESGSVSLLKHLQHARDFWLHQLLLLSPLLWGMLVCLSVMLLVRFKHLSAEQRFLWLTGPMLVLAILLLSFTRKMQGNWPMPFYLSGLILLAGYWQSGHWQRLLRWALAMGLTMVIVTYFLPLLLPLTPLQKTAWDPIKRFKNWQTVASEIYQRRLQTQADLADSFVVTLGHRNLTSQLAFYLPDHPRVFRYEPSGQITSQYEVWGGPLAFLGKNAFVVSEQAEAAIPAKLKAAFARFRLVAQIPDPNRNHVVFFLYYAEDLLSWPQPDTVSSNSTDYD